ncbi:MAG: hypothetical protein K6U08_03250 [Firmicutes bacterium]|nr:hypothetical protein [Bacillota bacterium]
MATTAETLAMTEELVRELCAPEPGSFRPQFLEQLEGSLGTPGSGTGYLLVGPELSGKSLVVRWLAERKGPEVGVLFVDARDCLEDREKAVQALKDRVGNAGTARVVIVDHLDCLRFREDETKFLWDCANGGRVVVAVSRVRGLAIDTGRSYTVASFNHFHLSRCGWVPREVAEKAVGDFWPGREGDLRSFMDSYGPHWRAVCLAAAGRPLDAERAVRRGLVALHDELDLECPLNDKDWKSLAHRMVLPAEGPGRTSPGCLLGLLEEVCGGQSLLALFRQGCGDFPREVLHDYRVDTAKDLGKVQYSVRQHRDSCPACRDAFASRELRPLVEGLLNASFDDSKKEALTATAWALKEWVRSLNTDEVPVPLLESALLAWGKKAQHTPPDRLPQGLSAKVRAPLLALGRTVRALLNKQDDSGIFVHQKLEFERARDASAQAPREVWTLKLFDGPVRFLPKADPQHELGAALKALEDWVRKDRRNWLRVTQEFNPSGRVLSFSFRVVS